MCGLLGGRGCFGLLVAVCVCLCRTRHLLSGSANNEHCRPAVAPSKPRSTASACSLLCVAQHSRVLCIRPRAVPGSHHQQLHALVRVCLACPVLSARTVACICLCAGCITCALVCLCLHYTRPECAESLLAWLVSRVLTVTSRGGDTARPSALCSLANQQRLLQLRQGPAHRGAAFGGPLMMVSTPK